MNGKLLHTGLVAEDTSLGTFAARVYGQHRQLASFLFEYMQAEDVDGRTLSCTRHTADSDSNRIAGIRQAFLNHFLSYGLVFGFHTLHQCHGLTKHGDIALDNAFHIFAHRKLAAFGFLS